MKYGLTYMVYFNEDVKLHEADKVIEKILENKEIYSIEFHNAKPLHDKVLDQLKHINDDIPQENRANVD